MCLVSYQGVQLYTLTSYDFLTELSFNWFIFLLLDPYILIARVHYFEFLILIMYCLVSLLDLIAKIERKEAELRKKAEDEEYHPPPE